MKRSLAPLLACFLSFAALAETPAEPPIESNLVGTIIFLVIFVGVCVVFMWMIWRKKGDKQE
jgi:heme/copper-type cytochrome/quinol oxidase subunit 2